MVVAEVAWDLATRDLTGAPFNFDASTARETTARLFYLGAQPVANWYQCTSPFGGCPASGGYLNVLAADDDNGNLTVEEDGREPEPGRAPPHATSLPSRTAGG